jgi:hypothetical protein
MGMQTLYGQGAITISDDRATYHTQNGSIQVPEHLVPRLLDRGFTKHAPLPVEEAAPAAVDDACDATRTPAPIDPTLPDEVLHSLFAAEAIERGYGENAAASIAAGRVAHLRSGGDGYDILTVTASADPAPSTGADAPATETVAGSPEVTPPASTPDEKDVARDTKPNKRPR